MTELQESKSEMIIPGTDDPLSTYDQLTKKSMPVIPSTDEKIKVFVRIRPLSRAELGKEQIAFTNPQNPGHLRVSDHQHYFESTFDRVFDERAT